MGAFALRVLVFLRGKKIADLQTAPAMPESFA
jgi:hypothetical protein